MKRDRPQQWAVRNDSHLGSSLLLFCLFVVLRFILFLPIVHMWVWVCVHESRCQWRQKEEAGCSKAGATGSCGVDVGAGS